MQRRHFGLLGFPIENSASAYIHKRIYEICGVSEYCKYSLFEISENQLSAKGEVLLSLDGFNVAAPYKSTIATFLSKLDTTAQFRGSVDCVQYCSKNGEHIGYNTEVYGFRKALEMLGVEINWEVTGVQPPKPLKVLLLGCGECARMMALEMVKSGAALTIAIRRDNAETKAASKLSQQLGSKSVRITYIDMLNTGNYYDLLLNTTNCSNGELPISAGILGNVAHLLDTVYSSTPSQLVTAAHSQGTKALDAAAMLVHQAAMSEYIWNGLNIDDSAVDNIITGVRFMLV